MFACLSDPSSAVGFRLAGVETAEAADRQAAADAFRRFAGRQDIGVIIVTGKVSRLIGEEIALHRRERDLPVVLEVPSAGEFSGGVSIEEFVRQALGVSI